MKKLISLLSLFLVSITSFLSCGDEIDGLPSDPIKWTSSTHSIKMADKYTHNVSINANADTLQFNCVNYSYPFIIFLTDPDSTIEYSIGYSSDIEVPGKESYYFFDTHEQHIDRPSIKVELKDNFLTVVVSENTSQNNQIYALAFGNSEGGFPTLGSIVISQAGRNP